MPVTGFPTSFGQMMECTFPDPSVGGEVWEVDPVIHHDSFGLRPLWSAARPDRERRETYECLSRAEE
jgi:hypothetical protein